MDNYIGIPTAEEARNDTMKQINASIGGDAWNDILNAVKNGIVRAIHACDYQVYIPETQLRGVSVKLVFEKLKPTLTNLGYEVNMSTYNNGFYIRWDSNKECTYECN